MARRDFAHARWLCAFALLFAVIDTAPLHAQQTAKPVTVNGLAFDSLRGVPLPNAFVTIEGRSRATTSDAKGRFTFDTLPPGTYTLRCSTPSLTVSDCRVPQHVQRS
jgi:protocatechuate 3,4-dioxygenase beta subunit